MRPKQAIAALVAAVGLAWGSAQAAPDTAEAMPDAPAVIIFELQPRAPGDAASAGPDQEQALMGLLLLQLLGAMQTESEMVDAPRVAPTAGTRI